MSGRRGSFNPSRYRNPHNLHVVPILSVVNNKPIPFQPNPPMQNMFSPVVPVPILPDSSPVFSDPNNFPGKFNKRRRKRVRKRDRKRFANKNASQDSSVLPNPSDYRWFNTNNTKKNNVADDVLVDKEKETEKTDVAETPSAEEHFEEVEVASTEGDGKRIPVGFRKTKLHYLTYKKKSFFKPKYYDFSSQRTVVNCLNVEDDDSVDVDVVSEAEYDGYETDSYDPNEKFGKIIEIEDDENTDIDEEIHDVDEEMEEESAHVATDETEESAQAVSGRIDKESTPADTDKMEKNSVIGTGEKKDENVNSIMEVSKDNIPDRETVALKKWINEVCIKGSDDLIQSKSLVQDKLDAWQSHLIGLEYLIEICDKDKALVLKYYCVLCDEEFDVEELPESYVINHINGCSHITRYLEKHFPNCGFKFNENSNYDFIILQKLCEKINENLGYYFLCITNSDYYSENKLKIKETVENTSHLNEVDFKIEKCKLEKDIDTDLSKNIKNMIEDMMKKIIPENEVVTTEQNKIAKSNESKSDCKLTDPNISKKPSASKPKYKGNNSVSAFLRLTFAATNKLKLSDKGKNKKTKSNEEQTVENTDKLPDEVKDNMKSQNVNEQLNKENSKEQIIKNKKPKSDQHMKSPVSKNIQNSQLKEQQVIETIKLKDNIPEDNTELKNEPHKEAESKEKTQILENSTADPVPAASEGTPSEIVENVAVKKLLKNKEKVLLKTTIHSKHCRKIYQVIFQPEKLKLAGQCETRTLFTFIHVAI